MGGMLVNACPVFICATVNTIASILTKCHMAQMVIDDGCSFVMGRWQWIGVWGAAKSPVIDTL